MLEARVAELECVLACRDVIRVEQTSDALDEIQQASERSLVISNLDRGSQQLRDARAALHRINDGSFGVCEECGEDIHLKRLVAVPWTALCIQCQEDLDRRYQDVRGSRENFMSGFAS
jgi:DnaK suppressor protein